MKNKPINISKVFRDAVSIYKKDFSFLIIIFTLYEATSIPYSTYTGGFNKFSAVYLLVDSIILYPLLFGITTLYFDRKNALNIRELAIKLSRRFVRLVLVGISFLLLLVLGFIALIVPFFIVFTVFSQVDYFVLLENKSVLQSFGLSRSLTKGNRRKIFLIVVLTLIPVIIFSLFIPPDPLKPYTLWVGLFSIIASSFSLALYYSLWRNLRAASSMK